MIKSTITTTNKECEEYPILKKYSTGNLFIVLFTNPKTGMVVYSENEFRPVGDYYVNWSEEDFTTLSKKETITLSNQ